MTEYQAGHDLDALVAERLFGWKSQGGAIAQAMVAGSGTVPLVLPEFSTDIREAWRVMEQLRRSGFSVALEGVWFGQPTRPETVDPGYACRVTSVDEKGFWISAGETAPLAICRAALKALRGPEAPPESG